MRINMADLLTDPAKRKELMVRVIIATQAREGIETIREQAEAAYEKTQRGTAQVDDKINLRMDEPVQ